MKSAGEFFEVPDGISIAHYFVEETDRLNHPGPDDPSTLWRSNGDYCYYWMEAHVDHDAYESWLLDVRTRVGGMETRDYLAICLAPGGQFDVTWQNAPIKSDASTDQWHERTHAGLHWFIERHLCTQEA